VWLFSRRLIHAVPMSLVGSLESHLTSPPPPSPTFRRYPIRTESQTACWQPGGFLPPASAHPALIAASCGRLRAVSPSATAPATTNDVNRFGLFHFRLVAPFPFLPSLSVLVDWCRLAGLVHTVPMSLAGYLEGYLTTELLPTGPPALAAWWIIYPPGSVRVFL